MKRISVKEHESFTTSTDYYCIFNDTELLKKFPSANDSRANYLLGCFVDGWPDPTPKANYYVGLNWIEENEIVLQINPKIDSLDFMSMFLTCLTNKDSDVQKKVMDIYGIDFKKTYIESNGISYEVTPFIILHFVSLIEPIIKKGLKYNYVFEEDNLKSKIKGKLMFSQQFKHNVICQRKENNWCNYQDYSINCRENQILKKALLFVESYITYTKLNIPNNFRLILIKAKALLSNVSDNISVSEIERFRINHLFKDYTNAISVAKLILKRFGYDVQNIKSKSNKVPPFWINMPLLFETYILSMLKLKYGNKINYHISTYGNEIDFGKGDEMLIMDAKYIYHWAESVQHENIRQLSGYARNKSIRKKLMGDVFENKVLPCMIIYPSITGITNFSKEHILEETKEEINTYIEFYKLGIKLPIKSKITLNNQKE